MNCPYCNKQINTLTGLQEIEKFRKHLVKCKKYPNRVILPRNEFGDPSVNLTIVSITEALEIRAACGQ